MITLLFYFGKQLAIAGLCYGFYALVLRNQAHHRLSRWFLLASICLAVLLPLMPASWPWAAHTGISFPAPLQVVQLPEIEVGAGTATPFRMPDLRWLYAAVTLVLLLRIGYNCRRIFRMLRQSETSPLEDVVLARHAGIALPFSFFRYIFWNPAMPVDNETGRQILRHELVHVHQRHTLDKLLLEVISAICWINPFFYLYKRELALVHEFLADEGAAGDKATYAETILYAAFQPAWALTNNFFHPPIQRRIQMLFSKPTKISFMNKLALLPLAVALIAVISCQAQHDDKSGKQAAAANQITGGDLNLVTVVGFSNDVIPKTTEDNTSSSQQQQAKNETVYTTVQNPPTFPGGEDAMNKFLARNIRYPSAAHKEHRTGTVMVQFIVAADGRITEVKVIGTPYPDLATEVLRVVNMMPAWNPGTEKGNRVAVQFNLPVRFELEGKVAATETFITVPWLTEIKKPRTGC